MFVRPFIVGFFLQKLLRHKFRRARLNKRHNDAELVAPTPPPWEDDETNVGRRRYSFIPSKWRKKKCAFRSSTDNVAENKF